MSLNIYKKKKENRYWWWGGAEKEIDHIPNKIQSFVLMVEFEANVFLIYAPELKGTNLE